MNPLIRCFLRRDFPALLFSLRFWGWFWLRRCYRFDVVADKGSEVGQLVFLWFAHSMYSINIIDMMSMMVMMWIVVMVRSVKQ